MTQADAIRRLKANEAEIRRMGIEHLSLFGSTARGDQRPECDFEVVARFHPDFAFGHLTVRRDRTEDCSTA